MLLLFFVNVSKRSLQRFLNWRIFEPVCLRQSEEHSLIRRAAADRDNTGYLMPTMVGSDPPLRMAHAYRKPCRRNVAQDGLSDLEPQFVCKACGKRGAILRGGSEPTMMSIFPSPNRARASS